MSYFTETFEAILENIDNKGIKTIKADQQTKDAIADIIKSRKAIKFDDAFGKNANKKRDKDE